MKKNFAIALSLLAATTFIVIACSKGGDDPPADPCAGVTIAVTGTPTNPSTVGGNNGSISASATGGTGLTFSLNNGAFQSSGSFTNLTAGTYTVTAKSSAGCTGTQSFTLTAPTPTCTGVNIIVTATATPASGCGGPGGGITASATGSTGFTFSVTGSFQSAGTFANLAAGSYTVTAKDANGCIGTTTVNVGAPAAGPLFSAVKTLIANNCQSCHNNSIANGGMNWQNECNIIANKDRIKARAVDNNPSSMPPTGPLAQADKDKITAWLNAGGRYSD